MRPHTIVYTKSGFKEAPHPRALFLSYLYLYALSDRLSDHSASDHSGSECEAVANATTSDGRGPAVLLADLSVVHVAT